MINVIIFPLVINSISKLTIKLFMINTILKNPLMNDDELIIQHLYRDILTNNIRLHKLSLCVLV